MIQDLFAQYIAKTTEAVSLIQERDSIEEKLKSVKAERTNIKKEIKDLLASSGEKGSYTFLFEKNGQQLVVNVEAKLNYDNPDFLTFSEVTPIEKFASTEKEEIDRRVNNLFEY